MDQADRAAALGTLDRFVSLFADRDPAVVSVFAQDADTRLAGSELSDLAVGPGAIRAHLRAYLDLPATILFEWRDRDVTILGDAAWVFADGEVIVRSADGEQRAPYRLTLILERRNGAWLWRHFHGSEPRSSR